MAKEFIQKSQLRKDLSKTIEPKTNGIQFEALEPDVENWIRDAERYWDALPETTRDALTTMIRSGPEPEMADGQSGWISAPQGWTGTLLAQAGYASIVPNKPPPERLPLRLPQTPSAGTGAH
ncbi:MAG: hypothetical protein OXC62_17685 [Aestuariivita sp.]|nr:hypothetical protein [Aestuariivita sp.]